MFLIHLHHSSISSHVTGLRLFALAAVVLISACSNKPSYQALPIGSVVLAFGDSITYGTGANAGEDYPSKLAVISGWQIVNTGVPGDTTTTALPRLQPLLQEYQPQMVIVELGGNDFLRGASDESIAANLDVIVNDIKASGAVPVLVEVPKLSLAALFGKGGAPLYRQLAEDHKVLLIDKILPEILADNALKSDPIHPNTQGYVRLAEGIAVVCREAGLLQ